MFDQVFEAQCVGLNCIQFAYRLYFSDDEIQLYMYVSICYQGGCCNALLALKKKVNQKGLLKLISPRYHRAHKSVEIEKRLFNHS